MSKTNREEMPSSSCNKLLGAFGSNLDHGTIRFLLDTLANAGEEDWEPILEPFVDNPSAVLGALTGDAAELIEEAKKVLDAAEVEDAEAAQPRPSITSSQSTLNQNNIKYTSIPGAHNRAISLRQLRQILDYIYLQADAVGCLPSWMERDEESPFHGQKLKVATINLYQVVEWVVKPLTKQHQCSMVEILATEPQTPRWFVSHAWAEPVVEFVAAVEEHAKVRALDDDTLYWICAYSNNQHSIIQDISENNPKDTSFYRAMQHSQGMLLCLDSAGTPFNRIWCCFEQAMIVEDSSLEQRQRMLLDIATVGSNGKAVVITDGREAVAADTQEGPQFALEFKRDRESGFPLDLLEQGYEIDIFAAQAAREDDRQRILSCIAGKTLDLDGEDLHLADPAFTRVNKVLRGIFAEAAARKAADAGRIESVINVLQKDTERTGLTLNLSGCKYLDLSALAKLAGHPSLRRLTIDCSYSSIPDVTGIADAILGLQRLEKIELNFVWCSTLEDVRELSIRGLAPLRNLVELKLDFTGCSGVAIFLPKIEELQTLEKLTIDYSYTQTRGKTLLGILQLKELRELDLCFKGCQNIANMNALKNLGHLSKLESLVLDFAYTRLSSANGLSAVTVLEHLEHCTLSFCKCTQLSDLPWLPVLISHGTKIEVDLSECKGIDSALQTHFLDRESLMTALATKNSNLNEFFYVGEAVQYYSRIKRSWLPCVIYKVEVDELDVRVRGSHDNFARKVEAADISYIIRRKNGQPVHARDAPFTGGQMGSAGRDALDGSSGTPATSLSLTEQFHVGESVEYFARDWTRTWLPGIIQRVDSHGIKLEVPGYREPRRVIAADISVKIRRKKPRQGQE